MGAKETLMKIHILNTYQINQKLNCKIWYLAVKVTKLQQEKRLHDRQALFLFSFLNINCSHFNFNLYLMHEMQL